MANRGKTVVVITREEYRKVCKSGVVNLYGYQRCIINDMRPCNLSTCKGGWKRLGRIPVDKIKGEM